MRLFALQDLCPKCGITNNPRLERPAPNAEDSDMAKWFILDDDAVEGPFSTEELNHKLQYGMLSEQVLVWGRVQNEWKPATWWVDHLDELKQRLEGKQDNRLWHYAYQGQSYGPLTRQDLVFELKKISGDSNKCLIWTKGMENWAAIHEFHDLMDDIGVNRRTHPRAPIQGRVTVHMNQGQSMIGQLKSISEGGFGASHLPGLRSGDQVNVEIQTENLSPINVQAQIRYAEDDEDFIGFKFLNINREALSQIISYVKKEVNKEMQTFKVAA